MSLLLRLPSSKRQLAFELGKAREAIEGKLAPEQLPNGLTYVNKLPKQGKSADWVKDNLGKLVALEKNDVKEGRVSGAVYHGGDDLNQVIIDAVSKFVVSNPLHPDVFPGVRKMESEIVSMCLNLSVLPKSPFTLMLASVAPKLTNYCPLQVQQSQRCRNNNIRRDRIYPHVLQDSPRLGTQDQRNHRTRNDYCRLRPRCFLQGCRVL